MPRIQRPYYNLHQIITGQYSDGNEFILKDGSVYSGPYHILPTGQKFTEFVPSSKSVELFELRFTPTKDILNYNNISGVNSNQYSVPTPYQPMPNAADYKFGRIERFFVQKRNNPLFTIMEIDATQYNSINSQNKPGINAVIWNKLKIWWIISKIPLEDTKYINQQTLIRANLQFDGIGRVVTNLTEFYK